MMLGWRLLKILLTITIFLFFSLAGLTSLFLINNEQRWCRKNYIFPLKTGVVGSNFEVKLNDITSIFVKGCFLGFLNRQDPSFEENSQLVRIGFFDKLGIMHAYTARIGGVLDNGKYVYTGFCVKRGNTENCRSYLPSEFRDKLSDGELVLLSITYKDNMPWKGARENLRYASVLDDLKQALAGRGSFPKISDENFLVQILEIRK